MGTGIRKISRLARCGPGARAPTHRRCPHEHRRKARYRLVDYSLVGWASHPLDDEPNFVLPHIELLSDQHCLVAAWPLPCRDFHSLGCTAFLLVTPYRRVRDTHGPSTPLDPRKPATTSYTRGFPLKRPARASTFVEGHAIDERGTCACGVDLRDRPDLAKSNRDGRSCLRVRPRPTDNTSTNAVQVVIDLGSMIAPASSLRGARVAEPASIASPSREVWEV